MTDSGYGTSDRRADRNLHRDTRYSAPSDLQQTGEIKAEVLVIGSCMSEAVASRLQETSSINAQHLLFNYVSSLPDRSSDDLRKIDFQFVQLAMRSISPEQHLLATDMDDPKMAKAYFDGCCERLAHMLNVAMTYNKQTGMLTFVSNFLTPQQNYLGRFLPRYDLSNPAFFAEELNRALAGMIST